MVFAGAGMTGQFFLMGETNLIVQQGYNNEGLGVILQTIPAQPGDVDITSPRLATVRTHCRWLSTVCPNLFVTIPQSASIIIQID